MKPLILKTPEGLYVCEIPIENEPEDGASDREWWVWTATSVGASPVEAYNDGDRSYSYWQVPYGS